MNRAVIADFDRIAAALERSAGEELAPAERALLRQVPGTARRALDVGCGDGRLSRALAARGIATLGIDVSPGMIALARDRTGASPLLEFRVGDVSTDAPPRPEYDVVVAVALVHHLPLDQAVTWLKAGVKPGGTLLIQDLVDRPGLRYLPINGIAWLSRMLRDAARGAATSREVEALYLAHGAGERYLRPSEVFSAYRPLLPGCEVRHHLEWRYTITWSKPR